MGDDDDLADHASKMEEVDAVKSNEWPHVSLHRESRFHEIASKVFGVRLLMAALALVFSDKSSELDKMASSDESDLSVASFRHDSSMGRYYRILQCGCDIQDDDEGLGDDNGPWRRRR